MTSNFSGENSTLKHVWFVRHGESVTNAGAPWPNTYTNPLTDNGKRQAELLSNSWVTKPSLIVTSPYIRTKQTAEPLLKKCPDVPHEEWYVQEFTQLCYKRRGLLEVSEKRALLDRIWNLKDPSYCDGPHAESFNELLDRLNMFEERLKLLESTRTVIFTHGFFLKALFCKLEKPGKNTISMEELQLYKSTIDIPNTCVFYCTVSCKGDITVHSKSQEHPGIAPE